MLSLLSGTDIKASYQLVITSNNFPDFSSVGFSRLFPLLGSPINLLAPFYKGNHRNCLRYGKIIKRLGVKFVSPQLDHYFYHRPSVVVA